MSAHAFINHMHADGVPSDGIPVEAISTSHYAVFYLGIAYTALGVVLSIFFLIFNIRHRNDL